MLFRFMVAGFSAFLLAGIANACPDASLVGAETATFTSDDIWEEQTVSVTAGGDIDLALCEDLPGVGNVIKKPDFTFQYERTRPFNVRFRIDAFCDTILLVNDADGVWHWDDDSGDGEDPVITLSNASDGIIDVWVGTYEGENCPAQLSIESFEQ